MHITHYSECKSKDRTSLERSVRTALIAGNQSKIVIAFVYDLIKVIETLKKKKSQLLVFDTGCNHEKLITLTKTVRRQMNGSSPVIVKIGGQPIENVQKIKTVEEALSLEALLECA